MLIALIGAGLEVARWMSARPLWLDEEMIALNVRERPLADLAGPLWLAQSAPFGWLAVQRLVVLTLGTGERALRLVPATFGIGTLAAAVWIGRRWMSPAGAVVLVLLCSFGQWISFYALELKHYSADTFWALLLPALGAWVIEIRTEASVQESSVMERRRVLVWWSAAALGQWFGNGALLVTPACVLVLLVWSWREHGWQGASKFALIGLVWLVSFGLHYVLVLRHALASEYLQHYWSFAVPPASTGLDGTLAWLAGRLEPLAIKPGGTGLWWTFWLTAAAGFALTTRRAGGRALGILLATVPLSAFLLAALRIVPLFERVSLWVVPALYAGVALFADNAVWLARDAYIRRSLMRLALAAVVAYVGFRLCSDILVRGVDDLQLGHSAQSNHRLDDRTGVRWLMDQRRPGDVLMTTRLALPALWWYGGIPLSNSDSEGGRTPDGNPILEVGYKPRGLDCGGNELGQALRDQRRVLVYFGFRFDDVPNGFDDLLLRSLGEVGITRMLRQFSDAGRAAVIDLRVPLPALQVHPIIELRPAAEPSTSAARLDGCVVVQQARRW
jgi:MFS family permease